MKPLTVAEFNKHLRDTVNPNILAQVPEQNIDKALEGINSALSKSTQPGRGR
jgi:hypothetical protein